MRSHLPTCPGVYMIMIGDNAYYGMTGNLRVRKRAHESELKRNVHVNSYMQNAWNKHGVMSFRVLHETQTEKTAAVLEACYVSQYHGKPGIMNASIPDGRGSSKFSAETIELLRTINSKRCIFRCPKGLRIIFDSLTDANEFFGIHKTCGKLDGYLTGKRPWPKKKGTPLVGWSGKYYGESEWQAAEPIRFNKKWKPCVFKKGENELHFASTGFAAKYFGITEKYASMILSGYQKVPSRAGNPLSGFECFYLPKLSACA